MNTIIRPSKKFGVPVIACADCDWFIATVTPYAILEAEKRMCHTCCELPEHNHNTVRATLY